MPNSNFNDTFNGHSSDAQSDRQHLSRNEDMLMEQILENLNTTPVGKVLKRITSLPEVRKHKVLDIRKQLTEGGYNVNKRLDVAIDKVLEDLTTTSN